MSNTLDSIEFSPYPKTPRLFGGKDIIISEKIDGTNAAIQIIPLSNLEDREWDADDEEWITYWKNPAYAHMITTHAHDCAVIAQSRTRIITPGKNTDNFGFAQWVFDNATELVEALGTGIHRGEWYGQGIQRNYGLKEKRFALFAIDRYKESDLTKVHGLEVVPELWRGRFNTQVIEFTLESLRLLGSQAVKGFDNPEGIIIYHEASREVFKFTYDDVPKGMQS